MFKLVPVVSTTTVLATTPNPSYLGEAVNMTATVTAQDGSTPSGTVVFNSNGVQIGSAQLNGSGVALLDYSSLPLGTESLTAVYQGSGNFAPSTSNTVLQVVGNSVTSVTSTPNPSTVGQVVKMTATVTPGASGGPTPTGTVSFTSNGEPISGCTSVPLSSSVAVCTTSSLELGTDAIVASYSGNSDYQPSNGMLTQIVNPVATPIAVCADPAVPHRRYPRCQRHVRRPGDPRQHRAPVPAVAKRQSLQSFFDGCRLLAQRHRHTSDQARILDHLADRRRPAGGLDLEFA